MILAVDVGTSVMKAGVFDPAGRLLVMDQRSTPLSRRDGAYEIEGRTWLSALTEVIHCVRSRCPGWGDVEAMAISGNGPTIIPVGGDGLPLHPAVLWMDSRGQQEAGELAEAAGVDVDTAFFLSKVLWFRNRPDIYTHTRHFLSCPEYVAYHLTGTACTILPSPAYRRSIWTPEAAAALDIDPALLPPFVATGSRIGGLRKEPAAELALTPGLPVVAAGPDFLMSLLGTATVVEGRTCDRAGTSEGINYCSRQRLEDSRLLCLPHVVPDHHNVSGLISTTGKAVEWFREICGKQDMDYAELFRLVGTVPAGAGRLVFLPYLAGERSPIWDPGARGAFLGLSLSHGWLEMARAVVESIGFAIRDILEVMAERGLSITELRVAGTQARSRVLNQIKADITGCRLLVPEVKESELMGGACVGLAALGHYAHPIEAAEACVRIGQIFEPHIRDRGLYEELFRAYRAGYPALKGIFHDLASV